MVGLLFLALVYLAFGQADISRNGTQTAADAAALAAAQESRDQLDLAGTSRDDCKASSTATRSVRPTAARKRTRFAARNDARVGCTQLTDGRWGFTVEAESLKPMGDNIVEGTETEHAKASATAVVEPRCSFTPREPDESPERRPPGSGDEKQKPPLGKLVCDDQEWEIDPEHLELLPDVADLFTVRLAED